jgi:antitoxin HicB
MMADYRIEITPDDNGTFLVTSPAFPEVTSFGEDEAACRHWGELAIEEAIAARIHDGQDIPEETGAGDRRLLTVHTPLLLDLKVDLYRAIRRAGVTRAELARRLRWNRNSVDRLFDVGHASRLSQIEAAMAALGLRIEAKVVEHA